MAANNYLKILDDYDAHCARLAKATELSKSETEAERYKRIKCLEEDYVRWFEYYFPNYAKKKCAWFHRKAANLLIKHKIIRLMCEWYRSAAKSVHIDMGIPLYIYLVQHDLHFMLLVGETDPKAKKLLSGIQAQLQFNRRLISDYGEKFKYGDWANGDFTTKDGVKFMALGFGGNPRGAREEAQRPDYIVVDDVDNKKHVNNDRLMIDGVDYIFEEIMGCFDNEDDPTERFVYGNNNFHKNSITNRLKQLFQTASVEAKQNCDEDIYKIISVPAVKDLSTFEPNWPEKTSAEFWRKKYNSSPSKRSFMREFMNVHISDGAIFKIEDIIYGETERLDRYDGLIFYGDLSYKDQGDYKGLFLIGKIGRKYHIIHSYLRRGSRARCAEWLYDLYEDRKLAKYNIKYYIEGLFAMDEFVNDFDLEGDKRGYHIPVVADKRGKANKFDRVESLSGYFERHDIIFNEKEKGIPDQIQLIDQFLAFEKGSQANDDGPDACHGGISELNKITFVAKFPVRTTSRQDIRTKSKNTY